MYNYLEVRKEELKKRGNKGFTLMEMLIVVAIIAVLIAIAIPVFASQLENSREATDAANIRSAYAELTTDVMTKEASAINDITVKKQQTQEGWSNSSIKNIAGVDISKIASTGDTTIAYDASKAQVTIDGNAAQSSFAS